jgi:hypothetical protein
VLAEHDQHHEKSGAEKRNAQCFHVRPPRKLIATASLFRVFIGVSAKSVPVFTISQLEQASSLSLTSAASTTAARIRVI